MAFDPIHFRVGVQHGSAGETVLRCFVVFLAGTPGFEGEICWLRGRQVGLRFRPGSTAALRLDPADIPPISGLNLFGLPEWPPPIFRVSLHLSRR